MADTFEPVFTFILNNRFLETFGFMTAAVTVVALVGMFIKWFGTPNNQLKSETAAGKRVCFGLVEKSDLNFGVMLILPIALAATLLFMTFTAINPSMFDEEQIRLDKERRHERDAYLVALFKHVKRLSEAEHSSDIKTLAQAIIELVKSDNRPIVRVAKL